MADDDFPKVAERQALVEALGRFRGAKGLYREGSKISLVRLDDVVSKEKGLSARVSLIPTRGLCNDFPASWDVYSAWNSSACSADQWVAAYIGLKLHFDPSLISFVVDWCELAPDGPYDQRRRQQIERCIRRHRAARLSEALSDGCSVYWSGRKIGQVGEQTPNDDLEFSGAFAAVDVDQPLMKPLRAYQVWWSTSEEAADREVTDRLDGSWWVETPAGMRIDCLIPIIDFDRQSIVLRYLRDPIPMG